MEFTIGVFALVAIWVIWRAVVRPLCRWAFIGFCADVLYRLFGRGHD